VPAFAPTGKDPFTLAREEGERVAFSHTPYAEWYWNSISIPDSPAAAHHAAVWGNCDYDVFVRRFLDAAKGWNPHRWQRMMAASGAKYCVMVTKHHDGVLMWPSETPNPNRGPSWSSERDLVQECADAARGAGLRFGVYYSGGIDWTFQGLGIDGWGKLYAAIPQDATYHAYADAHWRELIRRYSPDVLWNDIGYPGFGAGAASLMADFYNENPDGVVNDRFDFLGVMGGTAHADFTTPEYSTEPVDHKRPFEVTRGIGTSFGRWWELVVELWRDARRRNSVGSADAATRDGAVARRERCGHLRKSSARTVAFGNERGGEGAPHRGCRWRHVRDGVRATRLGDDHHRRTTLGRRAPTGSRRALVAPR
jgi:alpha-L-fucosidase